MEGTLLGRIGESLKARQQDLRLWLVRASKAEKSLRLGAHPEQDVQANLLLIEEAINKARIEELGKCRLCHETVEEHLLEMDYSACVCLEHLGPEERSRLEAELELSQKVQRALLPHAVPQISGWEVAAFSQPASIVGGDYFDFLKFGDGSPALIIADVMGKGMPASMLMSNLQASLRILVPEADSPVPVFQRLNRIFRHNIALTKFVTIFLGKLDVRSGRLVYASAGHNPPYLLRSDAAAVPGVGELLPTGAAIGLIEEPSFHEEAVELRPFDSLMLYTDGVIDTRAATGESFSEDLLRQFLEEHRTTPAEGLLRALRERLRHFSAGAPQFDDTTVVVYRRGR